MAIRIWPDDTWQSYEVHFVPNDIDLDDYVKDHYEQD